MKLKKLTFIIMQDSLANINIDRIVSIISYIAIITLFNIFMDNVIISSNIIIYRVRTNAILCYNINRNYNKNVCHFHHFWRNNNTFIILLGVYEFNVINNIFYYNS